MDRVLMLAHTDPSCSAVEVKNATRMGPGRALAMTAEGCKRSARYTWSAADKAWGLSGGIRKVGGGLATLKVQPSRLGYVRSEDSESGSSPG